MDGAIFFIFKNPYNRGFYFGAACRIRTHDLLFTKQLL